jgi:phosphoglycerol geranylgeranyltransferase
MVTRGVYTSMLNRKANKQKSFAVLLDPDKTPLADVIPLANRCNEAQVDYLFVGGSIMVSDRLESCITAFKKESSIPVILFPGSPSQITPKADALFYLSLISGRNPELLIGAHVVSAPAVRASGLEIIATGYMVVDGGAATTVSYMSHSLPIPRDKEDIALCTAMAGEMLGKKVLYMDAGSGAINPLSETMIHRVTQAVSIPVIVGGGIRDAEKAYRNCQAGADIIVVGNAIERDVTLITEISAAVHQVTEKIR